MKNIHLLPTNNTSNLLLCIKDYTEHKNTPAENSDNKGNLRIGVGEYSNDEFYQHQNIYITNNDLIKDGNWVYYDDKIFKVKKTDILYNGDFTIMVDDGTFINHKYAFKIILTNDINLIKDGVQLISEEFIEWFVDNHKIEYIVVSEKFIDKYFNSEYVIKIPIK